MINWPLQLSYERPKNPVILNEIIDTIRRLERKGEEPTFNSVLRDLAERRVLVFHRTLRKYLDLLLLGKVLKVEHRKTMQPNIRPKQIYHSTARIDEPIIEAGERALLFRGLNWDIPSPISLHVKTDLLALSLSTISGGIVYAALEDALVYSLKLIPMHRPSRAAEVLVFAVALLATQKIDYTYLLNRAKQQGQDKRITGILASIDRALSTSNPGVQDVPTLYELRKQYAPRRKALLDSIKETDRKIVKIYQETVNPNEVVEYAGKQLGLRG
jgi:hypothetical protein